MNMITSATYTTKVDDIKNYKVTYSDGKVVFFDDISNESQPYKEMMKQVEAGELTIAPADEE